MRADSTSKAFIGEVNDDGTVTVPITYWMLELDDKVCCDVSVVDNQGRKLSTLGFVIEVEHANYSGSEISEDENEDLISSLIVKISEVKELCSQSKVLTGSGYPSEPSGYIGKTYIDTDTGDVYIETPKGGTSPNFHAISFSVDVDKKLNEKMDYVDYTYLPKYRTGANSILHFGGVNESSTEYQIAHLSEVIDPSVAYFVAKDGKETYIQPELITEELKTKYHVSSGMGNDARYYIPITDELIVLEYYISPTEAYYYLHTSADSIEMVEEVYVGKAQKLIDDSYASYYNLWSAQKTKDCVDTKLDKVASTSTSNRLYGISPSGEQKVFTGSYTPASGSFPMYSGAGNLRTSSPSENTHCANKQYVDAIKPIEGGTVDPDETIDAKFLGRLYMNEATGEMFYAAQNIPTGSYEWRSIISKAKKQSTVPTGAGYVGQLCLVGSSDFNPYDVYICVMSNPADNQYLWHKMCTTEAPA